MRKINYRYFCVGKKGNILGILTGGETSNLDLNA